jgi:DNA-binding IscR family transcriptional regulator
MVRSNRGPKGGFALERANDEITLLDIYEAIEGPLVSNSCLFDSPICTGKQCIFGDLLKTTNKRYKAYLGGMKLSELRDVYGKGSAHEKRDHQDR